MNRPVAELVQLEGPPDYKADDEAGGKIYVYSKAMSYVNTGASWWEYRMYYVNKDGYVYFWRVKNEDIPPQQYYVTLKVR